MAKQGKLVSDEELRDFVVASLTRPQDFMRGDKRLFNDGWGLTPFEQHRDSDARDTSNYERILEDLSEEFPDDVDYEHAQDWAVGWNDTIMIRVLLERPEAPAKKLYGKAMDAWEASWGYDEQRVRSLTGAALRRWLETRVTPVARRAASIMLYLARDYPQWDSDDVSRREHEQMQEAFTSAWATLVLRWIDDPDDEDYDGEPLPTEPPGACDPDYGDASAAFSDRWYETYEFGLSEERLKAVVKDIQAERREARGHEPMPGQGVLFGDKKEETDVHG